MLKQLYLYFSGNICIYDLYWTILFKLTFYKQELIVISLTLWFRLNFGNEQIWYFD